MARARHAACKAEPCLMSGGAPCAAPQIAHIEYFHDHARLERLLFDGVLDPVDGCLRPDPSRPGLGLELKRIDAAQYEVH